MIGCRKTTEENMKIPVQGFYMEPDWTRTEKARNNGEYTRAPWTRLYDIFDIYKDKSRIIAEGISFDFSIKTTFIEFYRVLTIKMPDPKFFGFCVIDRKDWEWILFMYACCGISSVNCDHTMTNYHFRII